MDNDAGRYRRFLDGDDTGLREIIDLYDYGLTLYVNGIVRNPAEAEDIVQDTFVKLAVRKPRFDGKSSFKTWLFTIARNCALSYLRRHRVHLADQPIEECIYLSVGTDLEAHCLKSEQRILLHKAMKRLHPDYFQVLYLVYFEELDTEEAAQVMHRSKRQISDLLYRAKKQLKTELEKAGFQYEEF